MEGFIFILVIVALVVALIGITTFLKGKLTHNANLRNTGLIFAIICLILAGAAYYLSI